MQSRFLRTFAFLSFLIFLVACSGGTSDNKSSDRSVNISPPSIVLSGDSRIFVEATTQYLELGAIATDKEDGDLDVQVEGAVDTNALGTYIVNYEAVDSDGNKTSISREVVVIDRTAPQLSLNGAQRLIVEAQIDGHFNDPGAVAVDNLDGQLSVVVSGTVNTGLVGSYIIRYTSIDNSGNESTIERDVEVVDTQSPDITLIGENSMTWEGATEFVDPGFSAMDSLDGQVDVVVSGMVDTGILGLYVLTYTASDNSGNLSSVERIVEVVDTTAPIVNLIGDASIDWEASVPFVEPGYNAIDTLDGTLDVSVDGEVDTSTLGTYQLTYTASDSSSNQFSIQREVIVKDTTEPVISLLGDAHIELPRGRDFIDPGAQAIDSFDGTVQVNALGDVDVNTIGQYSISYTAEDSSGNRASLERIVEIRAFKPFITTWKTDRQGVSQDNQVRINTVESGADFMVDWGDGQVDESLTGTATHTYESVGTYTIKIYGDFPYIRHLTSDIPQVESKKLVSLDQWGDIQWQSMQAAFANARYMEYNAVDVPDLSKVENASFMFYEADAFNGDLSQWSVGSITTMEGMFSGAKLFNSNMTYWDVSNVTDMGQMFADTPAFNQDLSFWDVGNVTNMSRMFENSNFGGDLSQWNVSNVTDMSEMFSGTPNFDGDLNQWDVGNVTNMSRMFESSRFTGGIASWNVGNVTDMSYMFYWAQLFNGDLSQWNVSSVQNMSKMFYRAFIFESDLSKWDVGNVTDMSWAFRRAKEFNSDLSEWDVSKVTDMSQMFRHAYKMDSDLSQWDVSEVTNMYAMFEYAEAFNSDVSQWNVARVTDMRDMFKSVTLSVEHYDAILNNWSALPLKSNVQFNAGNTYYSSASESGRSILLNTYGWTINDRGLQP